MAKEKICGIYCIENLVNHKKYIGQSMNVKTRWRSHKSELRRNIHENDYLQKAWNKYGEDNFQFYILEECNIDIMNDRERYYIKLYDTTNRDCGYNIESGGNTNKILADSTKRKISENHADMSGENNPMHGVKMSEESINKILSHPNYKNRKIKGEDNHRATISEHDAREIKNYFSDGHTSYYGELRDIAEKYHTTVQTVSHIKSGNAWKWL